MNSSSLSYIITRPSLSQLFFCFTSVVVITVRSWISCFLDDLGNSLIWSSSCWLPSSFLFRAQLSTHSKSFSTCARGLWNVWALILPARWGTWSEPRPSSTSGSWARLWLVRKSFQTVSKLPAVGSQRWWRHGFWPWLCPNSCWRFHN